MSNQIPIYSQVVPKSQYRAKNSKVNKSQNAQRNDFDPLNFNNGGNFAMSTPGEAKDKKEEKPRRVKEDSGRTRRVRNEASEGKVEAYLRQYQVSMRQQQHRHSAVRQAEHRVNLRSLPLNDVATARGHDRTPTDRHRGFPERDREGSREHRRERDRDRERERDPFDFDGTPLSPIAPRAHDKDPRPVRKSSSAHRVTETSISTDKRRFFCREWVFQKIAHCLEQRPVSKTCGALILGDAGSGKTALCQELSEPGQGPQARQQRALNRRLLARHFLQSHTESSLRPGEFVRTLAMQILSHSSRRARADTCDLSPRESGTQTHRRNSEEERLISRFRDLADDGEESSKPLLADSEDQRTDDEDVGPSTRRMRTIHRIHEREQYKDLHADAPLSTADDLPEILPRSSVKPTNPFVNDEKDDLRLYENHENLFLRNISQRQSKEMRNSRLLRQSSEPLCEKKANVLQKSLSTEQKNDSSGEDRKVENSPPKSRIPVANFRYPNKSDLRSAESSPAKTKPERPSTPKEELPEYQNILKPEVAEVVEKEKKTEEDVPPPIPSLPISPRTLIANAYYDKLLSEPEIQQALLPQNLEKDPDECFKKALLFPLLEIDPPKQCLFLLVDAIDEGILGGVCEDRDGTEGSTSVASLLSRHQHLFPQWLLLVCTARKHCRNLTRMFTGFRKITLDELQRAHVSADVQRYVLARLDTEPRLRARVSSDSTAAAAAAAALDHLRIKSDGCLLYLEKVLDGVADGFIALREIREIPGTLNGLYLWLAQRLFHGRRFTKVRLLLDVLLAARCGVTEEMLYKCLLTKEYSVTREDFNRRLHLLRRILVMERATGFLSMFHHSFAKWLVDVKHCTRRYLCCPTEGHAAIAMYYTLDAKRVDNIMGSVSVNQLSALMDFLESNRELALGYCNRSKEGRSQARRLWEHCSTLLNSVSANCVQKTPDQWRLYYNEYKSKVLKKIKMEKAAMSATGGGPSSLKKLSPIQERLYNILGRDIGEPLPGVRHNPLITSQSQSGQASVEVVQIPLAENSQIAEEMVQMLDDNTDIAHNSDAVLELPISEPELQLSGVGPSTSQEADRVLQPSTPTATPAPRQPLPTLRRRRRRAQRSPLEGIRSEYVTTQEASARLEALERLSTEATREHAQATNRLAAALEAIAERLREPITIVLQNTPQTP